MSKAIEDLQTEHQAILSNLQILDTVSRRLERGLDVQRRDIHDFMGFLKDFADKCHHGKEESILFPALEKAQIEEMSGPIRVMLAEHAQGRSLIAQMDAAVSGKEDHAKFIRAAKEYSSLLQAHIEKENAVMFPAAEGRLTSVQLDQLYDAFKRHEQTVVDAGRHDQLRAMLKRLKQNYPA